MDQTDASDFSSAARGALRYLRSRFGFDLWMVTRHEGEQAVVLEAEGERYDIKRHSCFKRGDSRIGIDAPVGAYLGVPLTYQDGAVFGTLCAIDSQPKPQTAEEDLPLVEMVAKMLSGVLSAELRAVEAERERERYASEEESDALTGLFNRSGWERMLQVEEERCQRYGGAAFILLVDLDGLTALNETRGRESGDKLIRRSSKVLRKSVRDSDVVARLSGDEFGVLGTSNYPPSMEELLRRVRKALERAGVRASLGMASRIPALELGEMWMEANQLLQAEKAARKLNARAGHLRKIYRSQVFRFEAGSGEKD